MLLKHGKSQTKQKQHARHAGTSCYGRQAQQSSHRLGWQEVPSFTWLVELLSLHSLCTNATRYAGMAPWSAATHSLCELLLTVQPTRVLFLILVSRCMGTYVCVHFCMCVYICACIHTEIIHISACTQIKSPCICSR